MAKEAAQAAVEGQDLPAAAAVKKTAVKKTAAKKTTAKKTTKTTAKKSTKQGKPTSKLVIVESPAKAKTIQKYLGKGYEVLASMGHVRDLPKSRLGVDIEHGFQPEYIDIRGKGQLRNELKKAAKKSSFVYLATDPDREGEAISWHLIWSMPSRPAAFSTVWSAITSARFCGRRSNLVCPQDACSRWSSN